MKVCTNICSRTLSVPKSEQLSESLARENLQALMGRSTRGTKKRLAASCLAYQVTCPDPIAAGRFAIVSICQRMKSIRQRRMSVCQRLYVSSPTPNFSFRKSF